MGRIPEGAAPYKQTVQTDETITVNKTENSDKPSESQKEDSNSTQPQNNHPSVQDSSAKIAEHSLGGQMQAARLHSQVDGKQKPREIDGKITQPAPKETGKSSKAPSMKQVLTNAGMKNVHDKPSDGELKTYYSTMAPAHDMIAKGDYKNAAAEYRKLANAAPNDAEKTRLNSVAKQLDVAQTMSDAKVPNLSFPPSQADVEGYFGTMKGKPMPDIKKAYENYTDAFYVHSETKGVDKGDVTYDKTLHNRNGQSVASRAPELWADVSDRREMHSDGRRVIDCEGFALIGQKCFEAAGFQQVEYAVMSRVDDPKTKQNESYSMQHIMITARRPIQNPDGTSQNEVAVISNGSFYSGSSYAGKSAYEQSRSHVVVNAYGDTFREAAGQGVKIPGGLVTYDGQAWVAEFDLDDLLKSKNKPTPK